MRQATARPRHSAATTRGRAKAGRLSAHRLVVLDGRRRVRYNLRFQPVVFSSFSAEVAELADALASGASCRKAVEVQILSSAPFDSAASRPRSWQAARRAQANALSERSESKGLECQAQFSLAFSFGRSKANAGPNGPSLIVDAVRTLITSIGVDFGSWPRAALIRSRPSPPSAAACQTSRSRLPGASRR